MDGWMDGWMDGNPNPNPNPAWMAVILWCPSTDVVPDIFVGRIGKILSVLAIEVEFERELKAVVDFDLLQYVEIEIEPFQVQEEHRRHIFQQRSFGGILHAVHIGVVLVIPHQLIHLDQLIERIVDGLTPLHVQL